MFCIVSSKGLGLFLVFTAMQCFYNRIVDCEKPLRWGVDVGLLND